MKIVIDISEELYKHIKNDNVYYLEDGEDLYTIVKNGISLPERHGRLIDADKLRAVYTKPHLVGFDEIIQDIDRQPTIIEAERDVKDEFYKNKE